MKTVLCVLALLGLIGAITTNYQIGTGSYDITGPIAEVGMMGYAMVNQRANGLHFRLRSRAFVIGDNKKMVVYVTTDACMTFTGVRQAVIERLQAKYGNTFTYDNVLISGEHTHSGPAGFSYYVLYDITSFGFYTDNHEVIVAGIVKSIEIAYQNYQSNTEGSAIFMNSGELLDSNINRSPSAYLANPAEERAKYTYDVDKIMTTLRFDGANGPFAALNFFPVHGTSMNNTNTLISGDNKGYASYLFEKYMNGNSTAPGHGPFIAGFGQSNEGDVSPNTKGAHCLNGLPCDFVHSTCGGTSEGCVAAGPGKDMFESTKIIGTNQFKKALELFESAQIQLEGPIDYIHTWVQMDNVTVTANFSSTGQTEKTCQAALGDSFAGGTTDGPGEFNFIQGTNTTANPYWNFIGNILSEPTDEQIACQAPKPILLNVGGIDLPYQWVPAILPLQILRVGQLYLVGVPGEFTTMSGRRLRDSISKVLMENGASKDSVVMICGLSGAYSHYITTFEEFNYQRYEGASTLYGPHTLAAYQQEYSKLASALMKGESYPPGTMPPDLSGDAITEFILPIFPDFDVGEGYGTVKTPASDTYQIGQVVSVTFYGGNPRNDFRTQDTFLAVQLETAQDQWTTVLTDSDWDTRFTFYSEYLVESLVTVTWDITAGTVPGNYRIQTYGTAKNTFDEYVPYTGTSNTFTVSP